MGLTIRRGTTKEFALTLPPYMCDKDLDGIVNDYDHLPALTEEDAGKIYKVMMVSDFYPERSYFKWDGERWNYINSDKQWKNLGTILIRIIQGTTIIDKEFKDVTEDVLTVRLTQDETLLLKEGRSTKMQVFYVKDENGIEKAIKSQTLSISVLESLWDEAVHNEQL